jgi:hypothetical protein
MKNKKLKTLLMTGALTLGLCVGCGNNDKELTTLQEKYDDSQKMVEQYKKDKEKLIEQNKVLEQDKKTVKSKAKASQSKEKTTNDTVNNTATKSSDNDFWYTCEKCGITNGKVKLHGAFYMCPNCISKQDDSSNATLNNSDNIIPDNTISNNTENSTIPDNGEYSTEDSTIPDNAKGNTTTNQSEPSFDNAEDDVTTNQPSKGYVYWTSGGKSYHSRRSCPTLKRSKTVHEGYNCPKTDPCNICCR